MAPRISRWIALGIVFLPQSLFAIEIPDHPKMIAPRTVNGRTIGEWLTDLHSNQRLVRRQAINALDQLHADAPAQVLAAFTACTTDADPVIRWLAVRSLARFTAHPHKVMPVLLAALSDADEEVADQAARALARFAPHAIPDIMKGLSDPTKPESVFAFALAQQGEAALPVARELLHDADARVRARAARAIGLMGTLGLPALSDVMVLLDDEHAIARESAIRALGQIGGDATVMVGRCSKLLADVDSHVRKEACRTLGRYGASARGAVPLLAITLTDPSKEIVFAAHDALREIGRHAGEDLLKELQHPLESVRFGIIRIIETLPEKSIAAEALLPLLNDPAERVRLMTIKAVAKHHGNDSRVVVALRRLELDPVEEIRKSAAMWIRYIER